MDKDLDGKLSTTDIISEYEKIQTVDKTQLYKNIENIMENVDFDKDGHLEFGEFLCGTIDKKLILTEENMKNAFNSFKNNKNVFFNKYSEK